MIVPPPFSEPLLGKVISSWDTAKVSGSGVALFTSSVFFVMAALFIAWILNLPRFVDYLVHCEVELRKVSWPTKDELKRQTIVVIFALVFFALVLMAADFIFVAGSKLVYGF